jgi:hypothetical protein
MGGGRGADLAVMWIGGVADDFIAYAIRIEMCSCRITISILYVSIMDL